MVKIQSSGSYTTNESIIHSVKFNNMLHEKEDFLMNVADISVGEGFVCGAWRFIEVLEIPRPEVRFFHVIPTVILAK